MWIRTQVNEGTTITEQYLRSTRVVWPVVETMRPLTVHALTRLQLTWTRTTPREVGVHRLMFLFVRVDSPMATFKGREIDRLVPAGGIPEEGIPGGAIWASRIPIYGTIDTGRVLWIRLNETCQASGVS